MTSFCEAVAAEVGLIELKENGDFFIFSGRYAEKVGDDMKKWCGWRIVIQAAMGN